MDEDELLIARLAAGDSDALVEALDRFGPLVYGLARRVTAGAQIAEDVTQEVFIELWRNPARFDRGRGSLRAFLAVQAHRRAIDAVRREVRRANREQRSHDAQPQIDEFNEGVTTPEDRAEHAALAELVSAAVNRLPPDQRRVVELAYFGGHSHREIAHLLGIAEGTAKSRLRLAHAKLKTLLDRELLEFA